MIKRVFAICLMLWLSACATKGVQQTDTQGLVNLRRDAAAAYQAKDYGKALSLYTKLTEQVPNDGLVWFRIGNIHARQQRPDQAIVAYEKAVLLDPSISKAWYNIGILRLRQAANSFTQSLEYTHPNDPTFSRSGRLAEGILELLGAGNAPDRD